MTPIAKLRRTWACTMTVINASRSFVDAQRGKFSFLRHPLKMLSYQRQGLTKRQTVLAEPLH